MLRGQPVGKAVETKWKKEIEWLLLPVQQIVVPEPVVKVRAGGESEDL